MSDTADLPLGTVLDGRYRLDVELGKGGMGIVYGGMHTALHRPIAVKVMRKPPSAAPGFAARFEREAFATARLDHPNCVGVLDCGSTPDGRPFIVMPRIDGVSLRGRLDRDRRLSAVYASRVMRHILAALAHAHASQLVHRDVKPANIMLAPRDDDDAFAVLLDFGVVKLVGDALEEVGGNQLTQAGFAIGSPTYMSPEQVASGTIDARSDLYSASIVFYEMLVGRPPFLDDDPLETVRLHLSAAPPPLEAAAAGGLLPPGLAALVHRNLSKQPDERSVSAQAYLGELEAILAQVPAPLHEPVILPSAAAVGAAGHEPPPPLETRAFPARAPSLAHDSTMMAGAGGHDTGVATAEGFGSGGVPPARGEAAAAARGRRSVLLVGGVGALAVIAAIVIATRTSPSESTESPSEGSGTESMVSDGVDRGDDLATSLRRTAVAEIAVLAQVHANIEAGRRDGAIKELHRLRSDYPNHAYLPLLHGTLFFDRLWRRDGVEAYQAAIAIEPRLRESPVLIRSVVWSLRAIDSSPETVSFLVRELGERAVPYLEEAMKDPNKNVRARMERVLRRLRSPTE